MRTVPKTTGPASAAVAHNEVMTSALTGIPTAKRRQLATILGGFAALFLIVGVVGAVATTRTGVPGSALALAAVALGVGVLLALMSWGLLHSARLQARAEQAHAVDAQLDAAIESTLRAGGGQLCDCGHEHDPTELHVTDDPCEHDGAGHLCSHTCDSCVLQTLRR
jgi:hypothetical protein